MKVLTRRLRKAEESAAVRFPRRPLVTAEELAWVKSLGCDLHGAEAELGDLDWRDYIVRFTDDELSRIAAAGGFGDEEVR